MTNYETVTIFTPVLTESEMQERTSSLVDFLKENGAEITHIDSWGMKKLAYPIQKKTTGFYFIIEYQAPADIIKKLDVRFKRDTDVLRALNVKLDQWGVQYLDMKRKGLIGKKKDPAEAVEGE